MKAWPLFAVITIQSFLCLAHWFMYRTWVDFWPMSTETGTGVAKTLAALSVLFVAASLASFRYSNLAVRTFYRLAALWMGFANLLFVAALFAWLIDLFLRFAVAESTRIAARPYIAASLLATALATGIFGVMNARNLRVRTIEVQLPGLPQCWRGRRALLISDMHLGHVNGAEFARRIATAAQNLDPDVIFLTLTGDLFDGSKVDAPSIIGAFRELRPLL